MTSAFDIVAKEYTQHRPTWNASCIEAIVQLCPHRERALEVGCGSGQATSLLASHFQRLIATDPAPELIKLAPTIPNVKWHISRAEEVVAEQGSVNAIFAFQAAHWFDMDAFAIACRDMAAEGCRIILCGYNLPRVHKEVDCAIDAFYESLSDDWDERRRYIDDCYTSLKFPFSELPPPDVSPLEEEWTVTQMLAYLRTWSAVNHKNIRTGIDPVIAFEPTLCSIWGTRKYNIRWQVFLRAGALD